jgi:hypothetical protein
MELFRKVEEMNDDKNKTLEIIENQLRTIIAKYDKVARTSQMCTDISNALITDIEDLTEKNFIHNGILETLVVAVDYEADGRIFVILWDDNGQQPLRLEDWVK